MTERDFARAWGIIQAVLEARVGEARCRLAMESLKSITRIEMTGTGESPFGLTVGFPAAVEMARHGIGSIPGSSAAMLALTAIEICKEDGQLSWLSVFGYWKPSAIMECAARTKRHSVPVNDGEPGLGQGPNLNARGEVGSGPFRVKPMPR